MCYVVFGVVCLVCCGIVFFCSVSQNNEETLWNRQCLSLRHCLHLNVNTYNSVNLKNVCTNLATTIYTCIISNENGLLSIKSYLTSNFSTGIHAYYRQRTSKISS